MVVLIPSSVLYFSTSLVREKTNKLIQISHAPLWHYAVYEYEMTFPFNLKCSCLYNHETRPLVSSPCVELLYVTSPL